jgi:hypothetical protein
LVAALLILAAVAWRLALAQLLPLFGFLLEIRAPLALLGARLALGGRGGIQVPLIPV